MLQTKDEFKSRHRSWFQCGDNCLISKYPIIVPNALCRCSAEYCLILYKARTLYSSVGVGILGFLAYHWDCVKVVKQRRFCLTLICCVVCTPSRWQVLYYHVLISAFSENFGTRVLIYKCFIQTWYKNYSSPLVAISWTWLKLNDESASYVNSLDDNSALLDVIWRRLYGQFSPKRLTRLTLININY